METRSKDPVDQGAKPSATRPATGRTVVGRLDQAEPAEAERLRVLAEHAVLDTEPEQGFDELTSLAAELCETPMALVSLVDATRQWFKSKVGMEADSTPRDISFCAHVIRRPAMLVVPDARLDPRFADNPLVTGPPHIRFYAGAPLVTPGGHALGALCVLDTVPRTLSDSQIRHLSALGHQVVAQLTLRHQAHLLAESQRLLKGVLDHTDAVIYVKDLTGRYLLANRAMHTMFGVPMGSIEGQSTADLGPTPAAELRSVDDTVASTGASQVVEETVTFADGSTRSLRSTKFALRDDLGEVYAVAGVSADVTAMAEQRRMAEESEKRWRTLVEHSPVGVAVIAANGRFLYANAPAVRLYGVTAAADIEGRPASDFVHADNRKATAELFASVMGGRAITGKRWQLLRPSGQLVDVELNAARISFGDGPAVQVELRDMTERVSTEQLLRGSARRWRAIFAGSPIGIAISDSTGAIVEANEAMCLMLGRSREEIVGLHPVDFAHPDDRGTLQSSGRPLGVSPLATVRHERRFMRSDRAVRWGWVSVTGIPGDEDETWSLTHVVDITDRKAAEDATAQSEADLLAVAAVAQRVHDGEDARQTFVDAGRQLADASYVSLLEPHPDLPVLRITASTTPELMGTEVPLGAHSATAEAFRTGRSSFVADAVDHPALSSALRELTGAQSVYFVPVIATDTVIGVLVVGWDRPITGVDDRHAAIISLLAEHTATALRHAGLVAELSTLAVTDTLTGLPNRRGWDRLLTRALHIARTTSCPLTVAIADLDHFKNYNDSHGHAAGDDLLVQVSHNFTTNLRSGDTAARWGGEEFAAALVNCSGTEAVRVLERVRRNMPDGQTCSIGYATWDHSESPEQLMARADRALYTAKRSGRDQLVGAK